MYNVRQISPPFPFVHLQRTDVLLGSIYEEAEGNVNNGQHAHAICVVFVAVWSRFEHPALAHHESGECAGTGIRCGLGCADSRAYIGLHGPY
jgi:hypothetical protein